MSASGKISAASESARRIISIPGDRFTARNTGMISAAFSIFRYSLSVCPVAAITAGIFLFFAYSSVSSVAVGSEKSIIADISSVTCGIFGKSGFFGSIGTVFIPCAAAVFTVMLPILPAAPIIITVPGTAVFCAVSVSFIAAPPVKAGEFRGKKWGKSRDDRSVFL